MAPFTGLGLTLITHAPSPVALGRSPAASSLGAWSSQDRNVQKYPKTKQKKMKISWEESQCLLQLQVPNSQHRAQHKASCSFRKSSPSAYHALGPGPASRDLMVSKMSGLPFSPYAGASPRNHTVTRAVTEKGRGQRESARRTGHAVQESTDKTGGGSSSQNAFSNPLQDPGDGHYFHHNIKTLFPFSLQRHQPSRCRRQEQMPWRESRARHPALCQTWLRHGYRQQLTCLTLTAKHCPASSENILDEEVKYLSNPDSSAWLINILRD